MKDIKQIQEEIDRINQNICNVQLGVKLATTQEVAFRVGDEIRPILDFLTKKLEHLEECKAQLMRK